MPLEAGLVPSVTEARWTTRQLTAGVAVGDAQAVTEFYNQHFQLMYQEARRVSQRDEQFCLDVVQDAMLKCLRALRPIDSQQQLSHWTRLLVRSVVYDRLRQEIRRRRREQEVAACEATADISEPLQEAMQRAAWLEAELQQLDRSERHLITARYRWGWTLQRIAADLGLSIGTVDGRIRRLVDRLRKRHQERHDDS